MSALFITADVQRKVDEAVAEARKRPTSRQEIERKAKPYHGKTEIRLADRVEGCEKSPGVPVAIPIGYLAAISFEDQPNAGLCRHLFISVEREGKAPSVEAVVTIAMVFGFTGPVLETSITWLEEFRPGQYAVNLVQPVRKDACA